MGCWVKMRSRGGENSCVDFPPSAHMWGMRYAANFSQGFLRVRGVGEEICFPFPFSFPFSPLTAKA